MKIVKLLTIILIATHTFGLKGQLADQARMERFIGELSSDRYLGRGFSSAEGRMAAEFIAAEFEKSGAKSLDGFGYLHKIDYMTYDGLNLRGQNVVAIVEGSDPILKEEYVLVAAHYDQLGWSLDYGSYDSGGDVTGPEFIYDTLIYNGANCISGVAAQLEMARMFSETRERPKRSILFVAFDGYKQGNIGAEYFLEERLVSPDMIAAVVSLDKLADYNPDIGLIVAGLDILADRELSFGLAEDSNGLWVRQTRGSGEDMPEVSPFRMLGIPSVSIFCDGSDYLEFYEETVDYMSFADLDYIVDFSSDLVADLADREELEIDPKAERVIGRGFQRRFTPGMVVQAGLSRHSYKNAFYHAKPVFAYSGGLILPVRFTSWFGFQPEILYEWSGSKIPGPQGNPEEVGKLHTHTLTVPASLIFSIPMSDYGDEFINYYLGGFYSHSFAGKGNGTALDFESTYSSEGYGLQFGVGLEMDGFQFSYIYQHGLSDFMSADSPDMQVRLRALYMRVGFTF